MMYLVFLLFLSLVPYLQADPIPDTNVQIQNYDGPIYLTSPKPNICPHCNGLLNTPVVPELEKVPCEPTLQLDYPRKAIYGNADTPIISTNVATANTRRNPALRSNDHITAGITPGFTSGTTGITTIDHGRPGVCNTATKNTVPFLTNSVTGTGNTCNGVTSPGSAGTGISGHTFPITFTFESHNGFEGGNGYYGAANPVVSGSDCVTNPLPSLFNGQNTGPCYRVPILTCNQGFGEDETILVPQKFSYALILDGEVANGNGNQNCPMEYNYVL